MSEFVTTYTEPKAFAEAELPFLIADEALHNLPVGITKRMLTDASLDAEFLATLHNDAGQLEGSASLNPGMNLLLSGGSQASIVALVDALRAASVNPPGAIGPTETARMFARSWCAVRPFRPVSNRRMGVFVLHELSPPSVSTGYAVTATADHLPLLQDWTNQFTQELNLNPSMLSPERLRQRVDAGDAFLWVLPSKLPAAMTCIVRDSPACATISFVYTPRNLRGQGFASACVAAACSNIFQRGKDFCALHADLDNPISTGMYKRLGFQLRATTEDITFVPLSSDDAPSS